ncbi:MAG: hypothetical protein JKY94_01100 [Rhodobacteraceae bacterium]|nr:hypothetical protein [Paracoccaceae bacterium]
MLKEKNSDYGITAAGSVWTFDNYAELVECAADRDGSVARAWGGITSGKTNGDANWFGTQTYAEAEHMALHGWPEGRDKMANVISASQAAIKTGMAATFDYDVAGAYPSVPEFVSGNPCHMVTPLHTITAARPIISIVVSSGFLSDFSPNQVHNYFGALMGWIDALESAGNSVELVAASASRGRGGSTTTLATTLKQAGDILELDRMAFALVHAASSRRIRFCVLEAQWADDNLISNFHGYGTPIILLEKFLDRHPGAIYLSGLVEAAPIQVSTPAKAAQFVQSQIEATETGRAYIEAART